MPRTSKALEPRLKKIVAFVIDYQEKKGYPPTIREIGHEINVNSTSQVTYYLKKLRKEDLIDRSENLSRSIRVSPDGYKLLGLNQEEETGAEPPETFIDKVNDAIENLWKIPVYGVIVASEPLPMPDDPTFEPDTTIDVARSLFGINEKPSNLFALEVSGDSMIDAMINDGDTVIFRKQDSVNNGEMAAIWIDDDNSTTLKYFYKEQDHYRLKPANPTMEDIIIPQRKKLHIMGKVVAVVRQVTTVP